MGSYTFILRGSGSIRLRDLPLTLINPFPSVQEATAVAFFFLPKVCTSFFSEPYALLIGMVDMGSGLTLIIINNEISLFKYHIFINYFLY